MKIDFAKISEFLGSTLDTSEIFGRVELLQYQFHLINPHMPVCQENLIDPSQWSHIEEFDKARINYRLRTDISRRIAYISICRAELMRIYSNRPKL
ncbi:hypothetical protein FJZ18_00805 [Candidatus Pacearchaeota archaeon]|nr:hypothetical protein [Candidatus Pacearchaeota archaeon]